MNLLIKKTCLEKTISKLQKELIFVGTTEGLSHKKTITISQKLDIYIAKYQKMMNS